MLSHGLPCDLWEIIVLEIEKGALLGFADVLIEFGFDLIDGGVLQMMANSSKVVVVIVIALLGDGQKFGVFARCLKGFKP